MILELFIEALSHNKSLSNAEISGRIQLTQILQMFVKAIFDEPTERTNWPSSQQNLNVNEGVFGTQLGQQCQDGTVCALRVSCYKFGLVFFQNCRTASAVQQEANHCLKAGVTLAIITLFKPDRALGLVDKAILIETFHFLTFAGVNPQFIKHDLYHRPVPSWRLYYFVRFGTSICVNCLNVTGARRDIHGKWQAKKVQGSAADQSRNLTSFPNHSFHKYRLYTKFRPPLIFVRAIRTSVSFTNIIDRPVESVLCVEFISTLRATTAVTLPVVLFVIRK